MAGDFRLTTEMLEGIGKLSPKAQAHALKLIGEKEAERIAEDPLYWFDASQHVKTAEWPEGMPYVFTKDPHVLFRCRQCGTELFGEARADHLEEEHGVRGAISYRVLAENFKELPTVRPFYLLEYMPPIINYWQRKQLFAIQKSRDMMATWLMVAMSAWDVFYHGGRQHLFQSRDAPATFELVERVHALYQNQPGFLKKAIGPVAFSKGGNKAGEFTALEKDSEVLGFPQGPDQIRGLHPSLVFMDEAAFQIEAADAFAAIKPAIEAGGKAVLISSANPGWFQSICQDNSE